MLLRRSGPRVREYGINLIVAHLLRMRHRILPVADERLRGPSAIFFAMHADEVYGDATEILSRTWSISRIVLVTVCVTATFMSGTPK
jgi:hypothetical protein